MAEAKKQRKLKCFACKELFDQDKLTVKNNKKYCKDCLKIKEEESLKNKTDWDLLFEYICELYSFERPTGLMFGQLKTFRGQDYNYTNIGMYYALKYYYEVLGNTVLEDTGLGIIPYYYEKAKKHYNKVFDLEDVVEEFENEEKSVKIKTQIMSKQIDPKKPLPLKICWEGNDEDN